MRKPAPQMRVTVALPVIVDVVVSVAVMVWLPAVSRVTPPGKVCTPLSAAGEGVVGG